MIIAMSVATGILQLLQIAGVLGIVVLIVMVVGRAHRAVPACPGCRYCVEALATNICPECGLDLSQSGVHAIGRRRVSRWYRLITAVLIACCLCPTYVQFTEEFWIGTSGDLLGRIESFNGRVEASIKLSDEASSFNSVSVIYPDFSVTHVDDIQSMRPADLPTGEWTPPQPLRLMIRRNNGSGRDYLFEPVLDGGWSVREVPDFLSYGEQNVTENLQTAATADELTAMTASRVEQDHMEDDTPDIGPTAAAQLLSGMVDYMMERQSPSYSDEVMSSLRGNSMMSTVVERSRNQVHHHWLALGSWVLLWILILAIVVTPGSPRSPWPQTDQLNQ